jgi:hypothetical protein
MVGSKRGTASRGYSYFLKRIYIGIGGMNLAKSAVVLALTLVFESREATNA